jgi:chromosome segregation ATPase
MSSDDKMLKILEDVQANIKALHAGQKNLQADVISIKDVQKRQGERLEALESGQKNLEAGQKALEIGQKALQSDVKELYGKVDNVELKTEAIHDYQLKAHGEIMGIMTDISEVNGQEQKALEKRVEVLEEHAGIPHPDKN